MTTENCMEWKNRLFGVNFVAQIKTDSAESQIMTR